MRTVPIAVYIKDELVSKGSNYELGLWTETYQNGERHIWGLVYEGYRTQMCYSLPYAKSLKAIEERRQRYERDPNINWLCWFFDVGRKLYVTLTALEEGLGNLRYEGSSEF